MSGISSIQPGATAYVQAWGTKGGVGEAPHIDVRSPASSDILYNLGKVWINALGNTSWVLTSFTTFNGTTTANWQAQSTSTGIQTLTGDAGGAVSPDGGGNINFTGSGGVVVTGTPGTNSLDITFSGGGSTTYTDQAISFLAVVNNGYFCTAALTVTLPAAPTQGQTVTLGIETAGAVVIQAVGTQIIRLGSTSSSAAGTATSTAIGSSIELVYRAASTTWFSISTEGSWTLA